MYLIRGTGALMTGISKITAEASVRNTMQTLKNSFIYTLLVEFNMLDFNPDYPSNPKTRGQKIRNAKKDKGLQIKELATILKLNPQTIIKWELENVKPEDRNIEALEKILNIKIGD
jgi:DNA-binding XRE family transcriptional regulator